MTPTFGRCRPARREGRRVVGEVACTVPFYAQHAQLGVLHVLAGTVTCGVLRLTVFVTATGPRRWFVIRDGADFPDGIAGMNVLEVHPTVVLDDVMTQGARADGVVTGWLDVTLYRDPDAAARAARAADQR